MRCAWSVVGIFFTMENIEEIWKDIPNYEGLYQVSNLGNVKSLNYRCTGKERILKKVKNKGGYDTIMFSKKSKIKLFTVHKLVAMAFLEYIPDGTQKLVVNHKDFNRQNNKLENIEIITNRENTNQKHLNSTSKYVGVHFNKHNSKWIARIHINGNRKYLGCFINEIDANKAYENELKTIKL